jgi:hypothetical protein
MAKLTIGQKAERVLALLMGLRSPKIAAALALHGFGNEDLKEGWTLLQQLTRTRLDTLPGAAPGPIHVDPATLGALDAWENKWFPIAKATLQRRLPAVHDWMFLNLVQAEGPAVILTVSTFVNRHELLDAPKDKGGPGAGGKDAKKILQKRGLTAPEINTAKELLAKLSKVAEPPVGDGGNAASDESFAEAETAVWAWYLEWSRIARTAIKDRRLLRTLGFLQGGGASGADDEEVADDEEGADEEGADEEEAAEETTTGGGKGKSEPTEG